MAGVGAAREELLLQGTLLELQDGLGREAARLRRQPRPGHAPPVAVAKRNARERNRVKQVNNGFATLRQHIPSHVAQGYGDRGKKLSKVETLRMAVEYIRGLQRLLAEADALPSEGGFKANGALSPAGSTYSGSTLDGSGTDLLQQQSEPLDEDEEQPKALQPRSRQQRRRPHYIYKQSFGDEENIEPPVNRNRGHNNNNNNSSSINNNNMGVLADAGPIKRELQLLDDEESRRSSEDEASLTHGLVVAASSSAYSGEIFIEHPDTGRLVPLKLEDQQAQLVYVSAEPSAYYKPELSDAAAELTWWEQECIVQQIQQQQPAGPVQRTLSHV